MQNYHFAVLNLISEKLLNQLCGLKMNKTPFFSSQLSNRPTENKSNEQLLFNPSTSHCLLDKDLKM